MLDKELKAEILNCLNKNIIRKFSPTYISMTNYIIDLENHIYKTNKLFLELLEIEKE